jgi:urease accessory protein
VSRPFLLLFVCLLSSQVYAHETLVAGGFTAGLSHPVLGLDHLLAMLSVGMLSAQIGGRAIWTLPATFVVVMLIGGLLGMDGVEIFSVELGIAMSVLMLGLAIAMDRRFSPLLTLYFVGFFAIFHGHAHGTEMPTLAEPEAYTMGFVAGTAGIHLVGVAIGAVAQKSAQGMKLLRYGGGLIALAGAYLIIS